MLLRPHRSLRCGIESRLAGRGNPQTKSQGSRLSRRQTLQSKICRPAEKRPAFNHLAVLHGRLCGERTCQGAPHMPTRRNRCAEMVDFCAAIWLVFSPPLTHGSPTCWRDSRIIRPGASPSCCLGTGCISRSKGPPHRSSFWLGLHNQRRSPRPWLYAHPLPPPNCLENVYATSEWNL